MKKTILGIILLYILFLPCSAASHVSFKPVEFNERPLKSSVNSIFQDSQGIMWLGTNEALIRYTGNDISFIREDPLHSGSISDSAILSLLEDSNGILWAGTKNGLNSFDPAHETNIIFQCDDNDQETLSDNWIQALCEDSEGFIWVGTSWGLNKLDPQSGQVTRYSEESTNTVTDQKMSITSIQIASNGDVIFGTDYGLARLNRSNGSITYFNQNGFVKDSISPVGVSTIMQHRKNTYLIGTNDGSIFFFNEEDNSFYTESWTRRLSRDINVPITAFIREPSGHLWFGTWSGLYSISKDREHFTRYTQNVKDERTIPYDSVTSLFLDKSGLLWIGLHKHGVVHVNPQEHSYNHIHYSPSDSGSISSDVVLSMHLDTKNRLWAGTDNGLNSSIKHASDFRQIDLSPESSGSLSISSICEYPDNIFWIGAYWSETSGLFRYDEKQDSSSIFRHDPANPASISNNNVSSLLHGDEDILWVGTSGGGLNKFNTATDKATSYRHNPDDSTSITSDWITTLYRDRQGTVWVGSENGLSRLDKTTESFTRFMKNKFDSQSLSNNRIRAIYEDSGRHFWIGTDNGLNLLNRHTGEITIFTKSNGLECDSIKSITEDNAGRLWLATQQGLSVFTLKDGIVFHLNQDNGLPFSDFTSSCAATDYTGMLYFGGNKGIISFRPDQITEPLSAPLIKISDITLLKSSLSFRSKSTFIPNLEVSHKNNSLSFSFALSDYINPRNNRYYYKLEGVSDEWNIVNKGNSIALIDLTPGRYVLNVKGISARGLESSNSIRLPIKVSPPFRKTIWFKILLFATLLLSTFMLFRYRTITLINRQHELERIVSARTRLLEIQKYESEENKKRYEMLVETSPDAIFLSDADGKLLMYNKKLKDLASQDFGANPDTINILDILSRHRTSEDIDGNPNIISTETEHDKSITISLPGLDGDSKCFEVNMVIFSPHHETTTVIGVIRDITERKKLEEQLEVRQRMESLGTLAGGIAHDFNNLLTGIIGNIGLLELNSSNLTGDQREYLSNAMISSRQATNLIKEFQVLSASSLQSMNNIDLHSVFDDTLKSLNNKNVSIENIIPKGKFIVHGNTNQLYQAILQMAQNSLHAIEEKNDSYGGFIRVKAVESNLKERGISSDHKYGYVHVRFEDNGTGMTSKTRKKAFNPFFSTKKRNSDKGQGLGLSVVYNIITHNHNGLIDIESTENKGTTIHIYLPLAEEVSTASENDTQEIDGNETILLIEDEKAILNTTSKVLKQFGYNILLADNGPDGLELYQSMPDTIDLVLLDLNMPRMSGAVVLERLLEIDPDCLVIITSGQSEHDIREFSRASGYIQKPYSIKGLTGQIRDTLDTRH